LSPKHALSEYAPLVQDGTVTNFTPARFTITVRPRRFAIEYLGFKNGSQVYSGATNFVITSGISKPNITPIYLNSNTSSNLAGLIYSYVSRDEEENWTYLTYYIYKSNESVMKFACDLYVL
jgi:hypothetical protein